MVEERPSQIRYIIVISKKLNYLVLTRCEVLRIVFWDL